jgi:hypothetical protein
MTESTLPQNALDAAQPTQQSPLSIDGVLQELQHWRDNREIHKETSLPEGLWKKIFSLAKTHPPTKIRSLFGISTQQYQNKFNQYFPPSDKTASTSTVAEGASVQFCQAEVHSKPPPLYQPLKIPATNTLVVEFCRSDGQVMRIHATHECLATILPLFFNGDTHAHHHAQA